jgi:hypothetical protein
MTDEVERTQTRLFMVYSLTNQLSPDENAGEPLHTLFDFGRFAEHLEVSSSLLPQVLAKATLDGPALGLAESPENLRVTAVKVILTVTPRGDLTLVLDVSLPEDADSDEVVGLLAVTCFRRGKLTLEQRPILEWVTDRSRRRGDALEFGRDVHQIVFPGGDFRSHIRDEQLHSPDLLSTAAARVIYRGTAQFGSGIRIPQELNNHARTILVHGRGVTLAAVFGPQIPGLGLDAENVFGVVVMIIVSALGVVHRARRNAFDALAVNEETTPESTAEVRALISRLSADLNDMQLDLSFGVEAYIDSVLIPESVVEWFQSSLRKAVGLNEGLTNTSRMLDRVQSVIGARLSSLESAVQEQTERSNRVFSTVVAIGSLIALPPALLLAFFGVNGAEVNDQSSIFDFSHYWPAYALAWMPFVALALMGYLLQRRIRAVSPQLRTHRRLSKR